MAKTKSATSATGTAGGVSISATKDKSGNITYNVGGKSYSSLSSAQAGLKSSSGYDSSKGYSYTTDTGKTTSSSNYKATNSNDTDTNLDTIDTQGTGGTSGNTSGNTGMSFGSAVYKKGTNATSYLDTRDTAIADKLSLDGVSTKEQVSSWMNTNAGADWTNASEEDRQNTIDRIYSKLKVNDKGDVVVDEEQTIKPEVEDEVKDGYLADGTKIYGYDDLSDEYKNLLNNMSESDKAYVSNLWAEGMQQAAKNYLDNVRVQDQYREQQDLAEEQHDVDMAMWEIQTEQTLRQAEESYNNLKQNWQYLGNMGMPGTSATKIQAIGDSITEAKTILSEIKEYKSLEKTAKELSWEAQVLNYSQKIEDLQYDLNWKVSSEIQGALSKYTTAQLEGQLDTIDGITAFRKELLDDLDTNLSGITSASLSQMQYINQQYQDLADRMETYAKNKNTVNTDMSAVKGYYVDGNGEAILNTKGEVIEVPQSAPLDPVFDKDSGKLITFGYDENGQIVANVQQIYGSSDSINAKIVQALNNGYSVSDILKAYPDADLDTVKSLAETIKADYRTDGLPTTWQGATYTATTSDAEANAIAEMKTSGKGGQCGAFVNDYLQKLGIGRIFTDPITDKTKNVNSLEAKVGSVVVMNSPTQPQCGHVGIITGIDKEGNLTILQSNKEGEEQIFTSTKNINDSDIIGFFDPTMSIEDYNSQGGQTGKTGLGSVVLNTLYTSEDNNASQNTAYAFAKRAWYSDESLRALENEFGAIWNWDRWEFLKSNEQKQYETYKGDWIRAWLRKDSGAAISADEYEQAAQYFPKAGDSKETIKEKQMLREQIIEGLFDQSGKADNGEQFVKIYRDNKLSNYATDGSSNTNGGDSGAFSTSQYSTGVGSTAGFNSRF